MATGPAHQSHGRLRWRTGFDLQEFMPQACHGALEMGRGSVKASCESDSDDWRPFTRHHIDIRRRAMAITPSSPANTVAQSPGSGTGTVGPGATLALAMR